MEHGPHHHAFFADSKLRTATVAVLALLALFLVAKFVTEVREWRYIGTGVMPANTISVQGEGEVFAVPDMATFSFSVIKEGDTAEEVQEAAAEVANEAIEYLKENGIEEKDIKTIGYNIYPRYEYSERLCITFPCPAGERRLVGFEISQTTEVKVRDTEKAGELLSGIGSFGVENISGLSFTIEDEDKLLREARQKALADAKEKAAQLAEDLDVRIVRVVNFNEYGSGAYARFESAQSDAAHGGANSVPKIAPGENRIMSQVNITYEIR